jgi:hypothetical protein
MSNAFRKKLEAAIDRLASLFDLVNRPYLSRTAAAEHLRSLGLKIAPSTLAKMAVI